MTTISTTSTFEISERATAAIEAGHEYVFAAPDGFRIKIGYVAGGGFVRVEARTPSSVLDATRTFASTARAGALRLFSQWISVHTDVTSTGIIAAVGVIDALREREDLVGNYDTAARALLMTARRQIAALLDQEES